MEKPYLARYICLKTHDIYQQGQMYTVEEYGMVDFGVDFRTWKIDGKVIDVTQFERVHGNIQQL